MADSRRASNLQIARMERRMESQGRFIAFLLCILISLGLTFLLGDESYTKPQSYVMFLMLFAAGLWITEAVPPFAVGILIIGFLVFTLGRPEYAQAEGIDVQSYVNTWSDSVIWLMLGGFFLAEGLKKTGLDLDLFKVTTARFSSSQRLLLLGLMLSTATASMIISNTATTAMMFAALTPLLATGEEKGGLAGAIALGIPTAAGVGGMGTIIGSPPNAVAVDLINRTMNPESQIDFLTWMYIGLPVALLIIVIVWYVLCARYKLTREAVDTKALIAAEQDSTEDELDRLELRRRKRVVLGILIVTVLLWLTDRLHPIPIAAVSGIPIMGLTMLSIVTSHDVRQLPWDTLMLVAGGLALGLAIQQTGLSLKFVEALKGLELSPVLLVSAFAVLTVVLSNVMSNTATVSILVPAAGLLSGIHPAVLPLVIGLCASCALYLPVSTPPNAIAFSTGLVAQKDFRFTGLIVGLGGPVLIIFWVLLLT